MSKIVIVTDSSAYMTREDAKKLGVVLVPMTYLIAGRPFIENYIGENGEYEKLIAKWIESAKTSQTSMSSFMSTFMELREAGYEILCLTISSRLSGTYSNAMIAARELGDKGDIRVVDTRTTSGGLFLMARAARKLIDKGLSLAETAQKLQELRPQIKITFSVNDLKPLRRSGRLGSVRQSVGTILNVKPILMCKDGGVISAGVCRGKHEQMRMLEESVPSNACEIIVQHLKAEEKAYQLAERLSKRCGADIMIRPIGPVLGIHLGIDVVGAAWREPIK